MITVELADTSQFAIILTVGILIVGVIAAIVFALIDSDNLFYALMGIASFAMFVVAFISFYGMPGDDPDAVANDLGIVSVAGEMKVPDDGEQIVLRDTLVKKVDGTLVEYDYVELSRHGNTVTMTPVENIPRVSSSDSAETK